MDASIVLASGALAIATAIAVGVGAAIVFARAKIKEMQFKQLVIYAELAVRSAEQLGLRFNYNGDDKKSFVLGQVRSLAVKFGFEYDEEFLDELIEAAVQKMNAEKPYEPGP